MTRASARKTSRARSFGAPILPPSSPAILEPIETPKGTLQVRPIVELDTHGLFRSHPLGSTMLVMHPNGFSCHDVAKHIVSGDEDRLRKQVTFILSCGGMARDIEHIIDCMSSKA